MTDQLLRAAPQAADGRAEHNERRHWATARALVMGQFAAVACSLLLLTTFAMFLGGATDLLLFFIGLPLLALSGIIVIAWSLWRPTWRKLLYAVVLLSFGADSLAFAPYASRLGRHLFFLSRRDSLEALERDILAYGKIRQMSDGQRHFKELNQELIALEPHRTDPGSPPGIRATYAVHHVLARDGIDRPTYDRFRSELIRLKLIEFEVAPGYVAFLYDGFLDNLQGFLHVRDGHDPPALHTEFFTSELVALRPLSGGWFWFATT